jgi:hypothetical protein
MRNTLLEGKQVARSETPGWIQLVSGGTAGAVQWFFCYPLDVIKSTMQTDAVDRAQRKYSGWMDCVRKMYAAGGPKMFVRGFTPWYVPLCLCVYWVRARVRVPCAVLTFLYALRCAAVPCCVVCAVLLWLV